MAPSVPAEPRELPLVLPWARHFWTGGETGKLLITRCVACARLVHPPLPRCPFCAAPTEPAAVSGKATVAAVTLNEQAWGAMPAPYVVAIVELVEDTSIRLTTNLIDVAPEDAAIGLAVEVCFLAADGVHLPVFRPARDGA